MEIKIVDNIDDFLNLKKDWVNLQKISNNFLFLDWQWMFYWWRNYAQFYKKSKLFIIVIYDKNKCVCIAPFFIEKNRFFGFKYKVLRFLASKKESLGLDVLLDNAYKEQINIELYKALLKYSHEWDYALVSSVMPHSFIRGFIKNNKWLFKEKDGIYSEVSLSDGLDDYLKKLHPRMRTKIRKMFKEGVEKNLTIREIMPDQIQDAFNSLIEFHQAKWEAKKESGAFGGSKKYTVNFLQDIIMDFARMDKLRIYSLYQNQENIGHQLYFIDNNTLYLFQEGYLWNTDVMHPGNILRALLMRKLAEYKKYTYNFMSGWTFHKKSWGGKIKKQYYIRFGRDSFKVKLYFLLYPIVDYIKGKIRGAYFKFISLYVKVKGFVFNK